MTTTNLTTCNKQGSDLSLYYNTGTCSVPVFVYHKGIIGDMTINDTDDENELATRNPAVAHKEYTGGKTDLSVSGEQAYDTAYEGFSFLESMRSSGVPGDVLILSGLISVVGSQGWRGKWINFDRTKNGPINGPATVAFNLKPAACSDCTVRPVQVAVADAVADFDPGLFVPAA